MNKTYIILFLLLVPLAYSAEQDWLISKSSQNNWNNNIQDTSLALLSLNDVSYTNKQETISWLETKMNSCTTSDSCNIKDASFALLVLNDLSASSATTVKLKNWLLNASTFQYSGETAGWKAQIISTIAGSCIISDPQNPSQSQSVTISAGFTPWVDIGSLISQTTNSIKIDCTSLSASPISLSLIREASPKYYINKEITNQKEIILELGYPCWGTTTQAAACDKESTAFALFALKQTDPKWLENQGDLTPLQNTLLYSVTNNNKYLAKVLDEQNSFGYWGSANMFDTAFISLIIPDSDKRTKALNWIVSQKASTEDCWPKPESLCNVRSTAAALLNQLTLSEISANTTETSSSNQTEERKKQNEEKGGTVDCPEDSSCTTSDACPGTCDYWGLCQDTKGDNCPAGDTVEKQKEECKEGSVCTAGACPGKCDAFGDCIDNAEDNCTPETTGTTASQTKESGSSTLFWVLMVLLLLIVVAGGGYLAYKKGLLKFKKKPSKPSSAQEFRHPFAPASQIPQRRPAITHPVKGRIQHELDSSITEMEKFLKGRKK